MKRENVVENLINLFVSVLILMLFNMNPAKATTKSLKSQMKVIELNKLIASDAGEADQFGNAVDISGDRAIVGSHQHNENGDRVGAVYIFEWNGSQWIETAKLLSSTPVINSGFGKSVSLLGDRAIIGSPFDTDTVTAKTGAVFVFEYNNNTDTWEESEKLYASDKATSDMFGISVSLTIDRFIVGAYKDNTLINGTHTNDTGSAYVFDFDGNNWSETQKLEASDKMESDFFGFSVSIENDRAIVGAYLDDVAVGIFNSGSAYIFDYNTGSWGETQKLLANDVSSDTRFGYSVSVSNSRVIIGASFDDEQGDRSGAAYIFDENQNVWSQTIKLSSSDIAATDYLGWSVDLSGDKAVVGAWGDDDNGNSSGSAYIFYYNGSGWIQQDKLLASDGGLNDQYAAAVAIDDQRVIVGSYKDDGSSSNNAFDSGAAFIYDVDILPIAVNDLVTISEDAVDVALVLMNNDENIDGGPLTIESVTQPSHGSVVNLGDYILISTSENYCNTATNYDTFTYTLNGGSSASVDVSVVCVDDTPVSVNDSETVAEDSGIVTIPVLDNDTDIDGGLKTISSVTQPIHGTVVNNSSNLSYQSDLNYCNDGITTDDFSYTLNGGSTAIVSVTVTCLDDSPQAIADSLTVIEEANATIINVLENDTDVDGGLKIITSVSQPLHGTVINNNSNLSYQPNTNYCNDGVSLDGFSYSLNGGSSTQVNVTVSCVNDAPSFVDIGDIDATDLINSANMTLTVNEFAFDIVLGPDNETNQSVSQFNSQIISDSSSIINSIDVDNNGTLTINFNPNFGTAIIHLSLQDNGGTANGGVNESLIHEFSVTVTDSVFVNGFEEVLTSSIINDKSVELEYYGHYIMIYNNPESERNRHLVKSWMDEILQLEESVMH